MTAAASSPPPAPPATPAASPGPSTAARRLDESIAVTRPGAWVALAAVAALIAVAVAVAWVVRVPQVVTAPGTVTFAGGRITVAAPAAGTVQDITVGIGAVVAAGDVLASVRGADGTTSTITAPQSGTVLMVPVNVGQVVAAGEELAELNSWQTASSVSVVAFVSEQQVYDFPVGSTVDVLFRSTTGAGTVTGVSVVRLPLEAVAEVVGSTELAEGVYQQTGGSPIAVMVTLDTGGAADTEIIPEGTEVTLRRVVSDPTLWDVVLGGGG